MGEKLRFFHAVAEAFSWFFFQTNRWSENTRTYWLTQWAAVRMCILVMTDPPQNCLFLLSMAAMNGNSLMEAI